MPLEYWRRISSSSSSIGDIGSQWQCQHWHRVGKNSKWIATFAHNWVEPLFILNINWTQKWRLATGNYTFARRFFIFIFSVEILFVLALPLTPSHSVCFWVLQIALPLHGLNGCIDFNYTLHSACVWCEWRFQFNDWIPSNGKRKKFDVCKLQWNASDSTLQQWQWQRQRHQHHCTDRLDSFISSQSL